jgi:hypothetical protein
LSTGTALVTTSRYSSVEDEPVPTKYNRHATTHSVSAEQYTELNALAAVMLMTSLLAEINYWAPATPLRR